MQKLAKDIYVEAGFAGVTVGAVVCISAAIAGDTSQDLKTGYIVGATPLYQQIGLVIGVIASAFEALRRPDGPASGAPESTRPMASAISAE